MARPASVAVSVTYRHTSQATALCLLACRVARTAEKCRLRHIFGKNFLNEEVNLLLRAKIAALLVDLDDRGRAKDAQTLNDRLRDVLAGFRQRSAQSKNRAQTVALGEQGVAEDEEMRILQEIFEQERKRHGISVPTDG